MRQAAHILEVHRNPLRDLGICSLRATPGILGLRDLLIKIYSLRIPGPRDLLTKTHSGAEGSAHRDPLPEDPKTEGPAH